MGKNRVLNYLSSTKITFILLLSVRIPARGAKEHSFEICVDPLERKACPGKIYYVVLLA
jgi:hypothetical protein